MDDKPIIKLKIYDTNKTSKQFMSPVQCSVVV